MRKIKFLLILFIVGISNIFSQHIRSIPIELDKNFVFVKTAWVNDSGFCVVADKEFNGNKFPHGVYIYDFKGILIHESMKFRTRYSSQDDKCFSLGETLFYIEDETNDMGGYQFRIAAYIGKDGIVHDERNEIFYISHSKEHKLLEKDNFKFNAYPGSGSRKALLTYNNDYADSVKEGFRFRILQSDGHLSTEDTLVLPYVDRLCSIVDVIYDDEKMEIFLLCNLFEDKEDKKQYLKSVFVKYDIKSKLASESIGELATYSKCKIQHLYENGVVAYNGLKVDEVEPSNWAVAFSAINLNSMNVEFAKNIIPDRKTTEPFYYRKKLLSEYIYPVSFLKSKDNIYFAGWTKFFSLRQIPAMINDPTNQNSVIPIMIMPGIAGLIGAAIMVGAATAFYSTHKNLISHEFSVWYKYSPGSDLFVSDSIGSNNPWKNYNTFSFAGLASGNELYSLSNSVALTDSNKSVIQLKQLENINKKDSISIDGEISFSPVNVIYPCSEYRSGNRSYFIGLYLNGNDMNVSNKTSYLNQHYLIIVD